MSRVLRSKRPSSSVQPHTVSPRAADANDVHPMYTLIHRHGQMAPAAFIRLVRRFRVCKTEDLDAERLLATYGHLISAMITLRSPAGAAGVAYRERAIPAAIAAYFEVLRDRTVPARTLTLQKAINERVTRALEQELSLGRPLTVPAISVWRATKVVRTADAVFMGESDGVTQDEIYAILGERIRVHNIHLVLRSNHPLELCPLSPASQETTGGSAAEARERLARALVTLPPTVARQLAERHGLFGCRVVPVADAAAALGVHPATYRRSLARAEAALRAALVAQGDPAARVSPAESSTPPDRGGTPWSAGSPVGGVADRADDYQRELTAGQARSARRTALAILRCAAYKGWEKAETEAAVRRLVAFRTGHGAPARHPLTARILDQIRAIQHGKQRSRRRARSGGP